MSFKTTIHKLAGAALAAATLLAVAPLGAANAAGDGNISVPSAVAAPYAGETITIQGDKKMIENHKFKAVRIGTYVNAKGTANVDGKTGVLNAVSVGTDPQLRDEATAALRAVKGGDADVHYQGNPVGEVAAKWLGYPSQVNGGNANEDTTSNYGTAADAWNGKLRQFVSNVFYSAKFTSLVSAATAQSTVASDTGDKMAVSISGLLPGIYMVDDVTGEAGVSGQSGAADPKTAGNSIPMLVSTAITDGGVTYNEMAGDRTLGLVDMKNDAPTVSKELDSDKTNDASIGGELHYKLTGSVPLTTGFRRYIYTMVDRPAQLGLHYVDNSETVMVGTTKLNAANGDYKVTAHKAAAGRFQSIAGDDSTDYVVFDLSPSILRFHYQDAITITYTMSITDDATGGQLQNGVTLSYSSDANNQPTATNASDPTEATIDPNTGNVSGSDTGSIASNSTSPQNPASVASFRKFSVITKPKVAWDDAKDEKEQDAIAGLAGAKYRLSAAAASAQSRSGEAAAADAALKFIKLGDGHYKLVAAQSATNDDFVEDLEVGSDGVLTFDGLGKGYYTVKEVAAPAGFSDTFMPSFKVHVQADATNASKSTYTNESDTWRLVVAHSQSVSSETPIVVLAITSISQLPLTGGAGMVLALLLIVVLLVVTGLLIMARRRLRKE
ncbi:isopeptide-forming domain-containing fimbrial protein [Bifidobacterium sp. ESL0775]|uniref:isopeptide-forming domain-containing fimbrial protein n=1 Tax=Bifidobacterium sp. ESL0775 TaxID=2983230 RepID=UPI0023F90193|nr:isopeptide-forming domain-containing fimbrial protein [Bifidobacterium sp. ESL0775]WEV69537.1 isopeptide-forming domain-containing fimbrial protein [Bifidobacterium sp. ESL0775]